MSERHREGLAHLLYGIQQPGGFVQLTGEVGTGKTTLCRCLLEQLPAGVDVALVLNPRLTVVEFLATVCDELHVAYPPACGSVKVLVDALHRYLLEAHARGRRSVLIVDEAQNLSADVLEQIRLLTNLETAAEKLLQIVLIGQPELARLLEGRHLRQLAQRITARYHLLPFSARDTSAYIRHRLKVAGGAQEVFTGAAIRCVRRLSGGVPRLINVICDRALLGAYAHDRRRIDAATVRQAGREVHGVAERERRSGWLAWAVGLTAVGVVASSLAILGTPTTISMPWQRSPAAMATPERSTDGAFDAKAESGPQRDAVSPASGAHEPTVRVAAAESGTRPSPRLADLLANPTASGADHAAFAGLHALWGVPYRKTGSGLACDAARAEGLDCLFRFGNWNRLRRLDLPVILELTGPAGERRRALLVALRDERATLVIGGNEHTLSLAEIGALWDGSFIVVWKPPPAGSRVMSRGMKGKDVEWLRMKLSALDGTPPSNRSADLYDADVERRVVAFQRERSLNPDGRVGGETLLHLTLAVREPGVPSLSRTP
jgi:general secretion pathway protein A